KMEREYRAKGVQFVAVNVGPDDTIIDMAAQAVEHGVAFPFVKDFDGRVADALGAGKTPEVVVLDGERRIRYRGRIDDQFRPTGSLPEPTRRHLKEALDQLLAGKDVLAPETTVDGCPITKPDRTKPDRPVTYAEQVGPILVKHCGDCHRPGAEAPFSLG